MVEVLFEQGGGPGVEAVTHLPPHHGDEVFAVALLILAHPGQDILVRRVARRPDVLQQFVQNPNIWVLDVGGVYNPASGNFDHHQVDDGQLPSHQEGSPTASFGMLWKELGLLLCQQMVEERDLSVDPERVAERVRREVVLPVDARDNGIGRGDIEGIRFPQIYDLIAGMNPGWWEPRSTEGGSAAFREAVAFALTHLRREVESAIHFVRALSTVERAHEDAQDGVMLLPEFLPWREHLQGMDKGDIEAVLVPAEDGDVWIHVYRPQKLEIPAEWRGLANQALQEVSGLPGLIFCHRGAPMVRCRDTVTALAAIERMRA